MSKIFEEIQSTLRTLEFFATCEQDILQFNYDLYQQSRKALKTPQALDEDEAPKILEILQRALNTLGRILVVRTEMEVRTTMFARSKLIEFRSPLVVDDFSRKLDRGEGISGKKTKMLKEWEARPYEVLLHRGCFVQRTHSGRLVVFDTLRMESHGKLHYGAYVISLEGRIYVFNHFDKSDRIAHSSFVRGGPVLAAGEIRITGGRLMALTAYSGHYKPDKTSLFDTLCYFKSKHVSLQHALVFFVVDPKITGLKPVPTSRLDWIFPSSRSSFQIVKEQILDETTVLSEQYRMLKQDLVVQGGLSCKFAFDATAFSNAVKKQELEAEEDLMRQLANL